MNMVAIPFDIYVAQALHGLVYGMLLFLVASGLNLVLGMMGVLNIAHASFYMLGAYFAYTVTAYSGSRVGIFDGSLHGVLSGGGGRP